MYFPPLHPMFAHFPSALVPIALACDVAARFLRRDPFTSLRGAGWWTIFFATVLTPLATLYGYRWMGDIFPRGVTYAKHNEMWQHEYIGYVLTALLVPLVFWRGRIFIKDRRPSFAYVLALSVVFLITCYQGHIGAVLTHRGEARGGDDVATGPNGPEDLGLPSPSQAIQGVVPSGGGPLTRPASGPAQPTAAPAGLPGRGTGWLDQIEVK